MKVQNKIKNNLSVEAGTWLVPGYLDESSHCITAPVGINWNILAHCQLRCGNFFY